VDYEFQIKRLEVELSHMREMQAIYRDHVNTLSQGHDYTGARLSSIETALEVLTANVNKLVAALLKEHTNGGG
jgi:hypothetical protein